MVIQTVLQDSIDVVKVECSVDIETESKSEDCLTETEQGQVPFSSIPVKQEVVSIIISRM
jgi:hypothetical protein